MDQGMQQRMVAGAAMQQSMRILQANTAELQQIVSQALQSNPSLEVREPSRQQEHDGENGSETDRHDSQYWISQLSRDPSLRDHLQEQILQEDFSEALRAACLVLLDSIDSRGYLDEDVAQLARDHGAQSDLYERALSCIQQLDPAGVGARDLRECLLLQLQQRGESEGLPARLLRDYWELLVEHRYELAAQQLGLDVEQVREAAARVARLKPHPGSDFAPEDASVIFPDVEVVDEQGDLLVSLTGEDVPQLAINADYRSMMAQQAENRELREYLSRCFREARDLITAIEQRQMSVLHVARAIVVRQEEFFRRGRDSIKPLKMEQIAADTQMHLSSVSRAVRGKYVRCRHGVFELRHFFQRSLGNEQEDMAVSRIYSRLRQWIAEEDKAAPLSDSALVSLFAEEGVTIARRTLAKYRDQLGIPPASQRR